MSRLPTVLIVDPDPRTAGVSVLLRSRLPVIRAGTASQALAVMHHHCPDLAIVAEDLPDLDGHDLCRAIRARVPDCPIVLLVDGHGTPVGREGLGIGIDGFFLKPARVDRLLPHLAVLFDGRMELPRADAHVSRAIDCIAHRYADRLGLAEVAALVGVSRPHLAHLFKVQTGYTVNEFVRRVRIDIAMRRLTESDDTLETIAASAGFADGSHLSRTFHHLTGHWPGAFRRAARQDPTAGQAADMALHKIPLPRPGPAEADGASWAAPA